MHYRKIAIGIAVILSAAGCTVERVVESEKDVTTSTRYVPPTTEYRLNSADKEELFFNFILEEYGSMPNTPGELLETGYAVCDSIAAGTTIDEFRAMIFDASDSVDSVRYLSVVTAGAIGFLCPEYMPDDV